MAQSIYMLDTCREVVLKGMGLIPSLLKGIFRDNFQVFRKTCFASESAFFPLYFWAV